MYVSCINVLASIGSRVPHSPTQPQYICNVELFLRGLTDHLHARRPGSLVIWYDSITQNGQLHWQNQLNQQNM